MGKQHYMTEQERHQLEAMRRNKIPVREIARQLGFCERTIYYELKRGSYMQVSRASCRNRPSGGNSSMHNQRHADMPGQLTRSAAKIA